MWKTFLAEIRHIRSSRWRMAEWLVLLFIPFIYGFFYMSAYWAPFHHTDQLRIGIVNLDKDANGVATPKSKSFQSEVINGGKDGVDAGAHVYNLTIKDIYSKDIKSTKDTQALVESDKYQAIITIPKGFQKSIDDTIDAVAKDVTDGNFSFTTFGEAFKKYYLKNNVEFYNSYKNNYLAGEMTNFGANLQKLSFAIVLSSASSNPIVNTILGTVSSSLSSSINLLAHKPIAGNIDSYGFGLSPYFISIAIWAGCLTMAFLFKNTRYIDTQSTVKHFFGKTIAWILTGWIQATILLIAVTAQGVNAAGNLQPALFFWVYFVSAVFAITVQAINYSFRYGDLGEFAIIILLVIQLVSSSGTFPVEMESIIFKIMHPLAPFTYSINGIREILFEPSAAVIFENMAALIAFPIVFVSLSLGLNYRFDKKNMARRRGKPVYKSYEIHMDDL